MELFCFLMDLKGFCGINLASLPDTALEAIRDAVKRELKIRGAVRHKSILAVHTIKNRHHSPRSPHRAKSFPLVLASNWDAIYPPQILCQDRKFYVYAHLDPSPGPIEFEGITFQGLPFYIGKGAGNRAYDLKRNEGHGAELRKMRGCGRPASEIVQILYENLTEQEAFCIEAKLIYFFGTRFDGVRNGVLVNLTCPKTPFD